MKADLLVIVGFAVFTAGLYKAFGWGYAAIVSGLLVLVAGARLQMAESKGPE